MRLPAGVRRAPQHSEFVCGGLLRWSPRLRSAPRDMNLGHVPSGSKLLPFLQCGGIPERQGVPGWSARTTSPKRWGQADLDQTPATPTTPSGRVVAVALAARGSASRCWLPVHRQPRQRGGRRSGSRRLGLGAVPGPRRPRSDGAVPAVARAVDNYDDVNRLATERPPAPTGRSSTSPYYSRARAWLSVQNLGWRSRAIVVPIAPARDQGLRFELGRSAWSSQASSDLRRLGLQLRFGFQRSERPQSTGASGHDRARVAIGAPDGPTCWTSSRPTGRSRRRRGRGRHQLLGTEGIFAETAGGVTVATAKKLIETGKIDPDEETVLLITGDGLKTLDAVQEKVGPKATVAPSTEAVNAALGLE